MNTKTSFAAVANLVNALSEDELAALVDNIKHVKKFAGDLVIEKVQNTYFIPIADKDVPEHMIESTTKWRKLAGDLGYTGPVYWKVREGFTLKDHSAKAGPCYQAFEYLRNWNLKNDEPTKSCHVYFIPRLVEKSISKNVDEQMKLLSETRKRYELPEHHLASFGSVAMLTGLVLAHFKRTGEKTPVNSYWVRTDTFHGVGLRLHVGDFDESGLYSGWLWDGYRFDKLGVFPLGVELG